MEYRELGQTGEKVSAIGVGCWAAGGTGWGGTDDAKTTQAFLRALELGINFFDTAPVYGFGRAERVLGEVLRTRRDEVFLATKFGLQWTVEEVEAISNNLRPESIREECDQSLKRLQTDRIDLYQCHWPLQKGKMTSVISEDMIDTLLGLRDAGKIRHIGVSNFAIKHIELCGGAAAIASLQPPFSILRPRAGKELIPYCAESKIGVVCYSPMHRGLLSGKYKGEESFPAADSRSEHPDYSGETFKAICDRVQELRSYAEAHDTTIAGVSLNWVLSAPGVTVAIAGTRSKEQIEEAARGQGWSLSAEERAEISEMFKDYAKPRG